MHDGPKIVAGIVVFLGIVTTPFWLTLSTGDPAHRPEPELPAVGGQCVESRSYMTDAHMDLLNVWRDQVVRGGQRVYISQDHGTTHAMSLSGTCMSCHDSKERFCDRCHDYTGVQPDCWECHVDPTGTGE
jgi:hypothetical protein